MSETKPNKAYCNVLAIQKGIDPVGSAGDFEDAIALEIPLPWKKDIYQRGLPQEILDLLELWMQRYREGKPYGHRMMMIAPDEGYSHESLRRLIYYKRPAQDEPFAQFEKIEYHVPTELLGALTWAIYEAQDQLPRYEAYRVHGAENVRDLIICTHGTIDAACAKFGFPIYDYLRKNHADEHLRIWRCSHFGGHIFAPTILDLPTAHYWAYVEPPQADQIVALNGDVADLRGHYRGWAGAKLGFMQALERELWQLEGWSWFNYAKTGEILAQDDDENPTWAEIRLTYTSRDGETVGDCVGRVEVHQHIETPHTTGNSDTHHYPQYTVTRLEHTQNQRESVGMFS